MIGCEIALGLLWLVSLAGLEQGTQTIEFADKEVNTDDIVPDNDEDISDQQVVLQSVEI